MFIQFSFLKSSSKVKQSSSSGGVQVSPIPSPFVSIWSLFDRLGQLSQASPIPSPSVSNWFGLIIIEQLSQASPIPSSSVSVWSALSIPGQLSLTTTQTAAGVKFWVDKPLYWSTAVYVKVLQMVLFNWAVATTVAGMSILISSP